MILQQIFKNTAGTFWIWFNYDFIDLKQAISIYKFDGNNDTTTYYQMTLLLMILYLLVTWWHTFNLITYFRFDDLFLIQWSNLTCFVCYKSMYRYMNWPTFDVMA